MSGALYTTEILRLALAGAGHPRFPAPDASAEMRTPVCGSRLTMDLALDKSDRIAGLGMAVHACAMGQAAAGLFAASAKGRNRADIEAGRTALAEWLTSERDVPPDWPGIAALAPARAYPARHAAILLPFDAAVVAFDNKRRAQAA